MVSLHHNLSFIHNNVFFLIFENKFFINDFERIEFFILFMAGFFNENYLEILLKSRPVLSFTGARRWPNLRPCYCICEIFYYRGRRAGQPRSFFSEIGLIDSVGKVCSL